MYQDKGKKFRSSFGTTSSIFTDDDASDKEPELIAKKSDYKHANAHLTKRGSKTKEWQRKAGDFSERPYYKGNTSTESKQHHPLIRCQI